MWLEHGRVGVLTKAPQFCLGGCRLAPGQLSSPPLTPPTTGSSLPVERKLELKELAPASVAP